MENKDALKKYVRTVLSEMIKEYLKEPLQEDQSIPQDDSSISNDSEIIVIENEEKQ